MRTNTITQEDQTEKLEVAFLQSEQLDRELSLKEKELTLMRKKNAEYRKKLNLQEEKFNKMKQAPLQQVTLGKDTLQVVKGRCK